MGIIVATAVISLWALHLVWILFNLDISMVNPWLYFHILLQAYLYTGLFITAHDAMHGNISNSGRVNGFFGYLTSFLFAGMNYNRLKKNHKLHHRFPASEKDPDYSVRSGNFFVWWGVFMLRYLTLVQILIMAIIYNLLILHPELSEQRVLLLWVLPAVLGTFQLFVTGVYWPHRLPHTTGMGPHRARTQHKNHLWALLSCYFFGYHREHHENPRIAWWKLYKTKTVSGQKQ